MAKKIKSKKIKIDSNMVSVLGIGNISAAKQRKIVEKLEENIQRKIVLAVLKKMSKKDRGTLDGLLKLKDSKIATAFINSNISNVESFVKSVAMTTIKEFKRLALNAK